MAKLKLLSREVSHCVSIVSNPTTINLYPFFSVHLSLALNYRLRASVNCFENLYSLTWEDRDEKNEIRISSFTFQPRI